MRNIVFSSPFPVIFLLAVRRLGVGLKWKEAAQRGITLGLA